MTSLRKPRASSPTRIRFPQGLAILALLLITGIFTVVCACQNPPASAEPAPVPPDASSSSKSGLEVQAGIEIVALRLTANGHLLDLRYKVKNPERAHLMLSRQTKPMLVDPATGLKLIVPDMAYVGALRQTAVAPQEGKTYFILFANPWRTIHVGQRLDLVLGDLTLPDLTVE